MFIDMWEMDLGDSILDNIEKAIDDSSFLIILLSQNSVQSNWVRTELKYAFYKERELGKAFIIPVKLEECKIPIQVIDKVFTEFKDNSDFDINFQRLVNKIKGNVPFSKLLRDFFNDESYETPYVGKHVKEGRRILTELGQFAQLDVEENQMWVLWECFYEIQDKYTCSIKLSGENNRFELALYDRWSEQTHLISLTKDEFSQGIWECEIDLLKSKKYKTSDYKLLGETGRLSFKRLEFTEYQNPFSDSAKNAMSTIWTKFKELISTYSKESQQSFLFDLQHLLFRTNRKAKLVFGKGISGDCLASSSMLQTNEHNYADRGRAIFELYDFFFRTLKYTVICSNHLDNYWEADIDLMSPKSEIIVHLG